jgi:peroxiredoxin Q/BCP
MIAALRIAGAATLGALLIAAGAHAQATPAEGEAAPAFRLQDQNGKWHSLEDYRGKWVVMYFYPKDNTPGCTAEACNLRDNYGLLRENGFEIVGISADSASSHQKFISKFELPFPLIADTEHKIIEAYGAWGEKSMYGKKYMGIVRTTAIVDEKGKIEHIIPKVNTADHAQQILDLYA